MNIIYTTVHTQTTNKLKTYVVEQLQVIELWWHPVSPPARAVELAAKYAGVDVDRNSLHCQKCTETEITRDNECTTKDQDRRTAESEERSRRRANNGCCIDESSFGRDVLRLLSGKRCEDIVLSAGGLYCLDAADCGDSSATEVVLGVGHQRLCTAPSGKNHLQDDDVNQR